MNRVAFVITTPTFGGPHNQALQLHEPLRRLGWDQLVITTNEPGNGASRLRAAGVPVRQIRLHRLRRGPSRRDQWASLYRVFGDISNLARVFKEENVQVVQFAGIQNVHIAVTARVANLPVVCQLLGTYAPHWMRKFVSPLASQFIDVVMSVGLTVAAEHPGINWRKQPIISFLPPVNVHELNNAAECREQARVELGIPTSGIVVITLGIFAPPKAHEVLVESAKILCERYSGVYCRILGSSAPGHESYYETEVINRARILGLLDYDRLRVVEVGAQAYKYLAAGDIFVLSSIAEGIPTAMLEAMALGMPVVATSVGCIPEVMSRANAGFVVPTRDPDKLAEAIVQLIENAHLRKEFGENGKMFVSKYVDVQRCAALHAEAYELAIKRHRS